MLKTERESFPKEMVIETHGREIREELQEHLGRMILEHQISNDPEVILWRWLKNDPGKEKR